MPDNSNRGVLDEQKQREMKERGVESSHGGGGNRRDQQDAHKIVTPQDHRMFL